MKNKLIISLSFASILTLFLVTGLMKYLLISIFTFCILYFKNFKINITKQTGHIIILYFLYILFEFISLNIENLANEIIFSSILPRHYGNILIIFNLLLLNKVNLKFVILYFYIFTLFSCIISILQFAQFDFALDLHSYLYPENTGYSSMELSSIEDRDYLFYGYPGLYENVVLSAQYASTFMLFTFHYFFKSKKKKIGVFFLLIFILSIFLMQLRSGLISVLIVLLGYLFLFHKNYFFLIIIPFFTYLLINVFDFLNSTRLRVLELDSPIRDEISQNFWSYVKEGNFFGKREYFANRNYYLKNKGITTPHNIFMNAYVLAGIPGFLVTVIILLKVLFYRVVISLNSKKEFIFKGAIFCYIVSLLTHNNSFHFGDPLLFIILIFHEKN